MTTDLTFTIPADLWLSANQRMHWAPKSHRTKRLRFMAYATARSELIANLGTTHVVAFVGGTTEWKLGKAARELVAEAKRRGKWVHMGRVNSGKRWRYAEAIGCDSVDGTFLTRGPDVNLPRLLRWAQPSPDGSLFDLLSENPTSPTGGESRG